MERQEYPLDKQFRETMKGHELKPSEAARAAFLKEASGLPPATKQRRGTLFFFTALVITAVTTALSLMLFLHDDQRASFSTKFTESNSTTQGNDLPKVKGTGTETLQEKSTPRETEKSAGTEKPKESAKQIKISVAKTSPIPVSQSPEISDNSAIDIKTPRNLVTPSITESIIKTENQKTNNATDIILPPVENQIIQSENPVEEKTSTIVLNQVPVDTGIVQPAAPVKDTTRITSSGSSQPVTKHLKTTQRKTDWSLAVHYTPEWMVNTLEVPTFVNNFGLEGIAGFGPFTIRSGAGISISKGTNEVTIEYNEYLGSYNKLDSMDFSWDIPSQQFFPTYYLSRQDVWDSLLSLENVKIVKRYTYLQIPVIFGYDFINGERLTLGFRTGPIMSVLLGSKELSAPMFDPGMNRIVRINDVSPGQVSLNWQLMAGFNSAFKLNEHLRFEVEPFVKYYFNSVYERPANHSKPWGFGARAAFVIDL